MPENTDNKNKKPTEVKDNIESSDSLSPPKENTLNPNISGHIIHPQIQKTLNERLQTRRTGILPSVNDLKKKYDILSEEIGKREEESELLNKKLENREKEIKNVHNLVVFGLIALIMMASTIFIDTYQEKKKTSDILLQKLHLLELHILEHKHTIESLQKNNHSH